MSKKTAKPLAKRASFIECMECLPVSTLPEGPLWTYEVKLDGYRLEAAFAKLPDATVIDGEVVAIDEHGLTDFNLLQHYHSAATQIHYFGFDILTLKGKSLLQLPLDERRELLAKTLPISEYVSLSVVDRRPAANIMQFRSQGRP